MFYYFSIGGMNFYAKTRGQMIRFANIWACGSFKLETKGVIFVNRKYTELTPTHTRGVYC